MFGFDPRAARYVWTAFLIALLLYIAYSIRSTLLVIVFAIFFAYLIYPLIAFVERITPRRMPHTASIALVFVIVTALAVGAVALFGSTIADEAVRLSQQLPTLLNTSNIAERIPLPGVLESQRARLIAFVTGQLQEGTGQALPFAHQIGLGLMHAAGNLIYVVLVPLLSFLLIRNAPLIRAEFLALFNTTEGRVWATIVKDLDVLLAGYVRALLLLSIATFAVYSIVFYFMKVPYASLLGGVSALLEFIPFVGPLSAAVIVLAVSAFGGYEHVLWLAVFILCYRVFQDYVLNPYLMSEGVEVPPLLVIVGLLAGEQLGGVAGIFLSVPVIAILKIVFMRLRARSPVIASHTPPKEKLRAGDDTEARRAGR